MNRIYSVYVVIIGVLIALFNPMPLLSQNTFSNDSLNSIPVNSPLTEKQKWGFFSKGIDGNFLENEMSIQEGEFINNILKIVNNRDTKIRFTIDIVVPVLWKSLSKKDKGYEIEPGDSMYIPVMMLPNGIVGNSNYLINAFVLSEDNEHLADLYFLVSQKIISKWEVTTYPSRAVYFPMGSDTTSFLLNITNQGNQDQKLKLSFNSKTPNFVVEHPLDRPLKAEEKLIAVPSQQGVEIPLKVKIGDLKQNFKRFDMENHVPHTFGETKNYTLFINTVQTTNYIGKPATNMTKLKFIKLSNEKKVNESAYSGIPLTVQGDMYGIFSQNVSMNLFLYGQTDLGPDRFITYRYQMPISSYSLNNFKFENGSPNLGYYFPKGNIQIGNVSGGMGGGGRGISTTYRLTPKRSVSAFLATNPYFFHDIGQINYGLAHRASTNGFITGYSNAYSFQKDLITGTRVDFLANTIAFNVFNKHRLTFNNTIGNTNHTENGVSVNRLSLSGGAGYSSFFFKKKLNVSAAMQSSNNFYGIYYANILTNNLSLNYSPGRNWKTNFNYYNVNSNPSYLNSTTGAFTNLPGSKMQNFSLGVTNPIVFGGVSPSVFYTRNINQYLSTSSKGLNLFYSYFNSVQNYRFSVSGKGAYTTLLDLPKVAPYFTATITNRIGWRTFSANLFYFYGPFSTGEQNLLIHNSSFQPQTFKANFSFSHLFNNDRFATYFTTNFRYSNYLDKYYISLMPTLFYYTVTKWRFYIGFQYFINSGLRAQGVSGTLSPFLQPTTDEGIPIVTKSAAVNVGFKKDILFPVFGRKNFNINFEAFLDDNGNGKKDVNEEAVKDVIIRFNEHEIQTNEKGKAKLINLPMGMYKAISMSLNELDGYFSKPQDSVMIIKDQIFYIPFVRGVRIYGSLILDKEKYTTINEDFFDLSKIRISVVDTMGKEYNSLTGFDGGFMIYVPTGKYILSMNEEVLGQRFRLVQNNIPLFLSKNLENIYVSLYIIEKRRKVNIKKFNNNNGDFINKDQNPSDTLPSIKQQPIEEQYRDTSNQNGSQGLNNTGNQNDEAPQQNGTPDNAPEGADNPGLNERNVADPKNPLYNPQAQDSPIAGTDKVKYYVQQGNKLEDIANAYGMTLEQIKTENKLKNNDLMPGQLLKVNKMEQPADVSYTLTSTTVLPGEDLYQLYKRVGMTVEEIVKVNNLKSDKIKPGQVLRVKKY